MTKPMVSPGIERSVVQRADATAWARALYFCAFGQEPDAVWRTESLRSGAGLSFFLRHDEGVCLGAFGVALPNAQEQAAQTMRVLVELQHRFAVLGPATAQPPEMSPRSLPVLCAPQGVVVARGQSGFLALADESLPRGAPPWFLGVRLALSLALATPPRPDLVVVFPERGTKDFCALLRNADGRERRGRIHVSQGRLWFRALDAPWLGRGQASPSEMDAPSPAVKPNLVEVAVTLAGCGWSDAPLAPQSLSLVLESGESDVLSSGWSFVRQGARIGLRFKSEAPV